VSSKFQLVAQDILETQVNIEVIDFSCFSIQDHFCVVNMGIVFANQLMVQDFLRKTPVFS